MTYSHTTTDFRAARLFYNTSLFVLQSLSKANYLYIFRLGIIFFVPGEGGGEIKINR